MDVKDTCNNIALVDFVVPHLKVLKLEFFLKPLKAYEL